MLLDNNDKYLNYRQPQNSNPGQDATPNQGGGGMNKLIAPVMDAGLDIYMGVSRAVKQGASAAVSHLSKYDNYVSFSYMNYNIDR